MVRYQEFNDKKIKKYQDEHVYMYHGSESPYLEILEPKYSKLIKKSAVFATPFRSIALVMSHPNWTDKDFDFGYKENGPFELKELKKGVLEKVFGSKAGPAYIYKVNKKDFKSYKNLQNWEIISTDPVKVISCETVENVLKEINASEIKVTKFKD